MHPTAFTHGVAYSAYALMRSTAQHQVQQVEAQTKIRLAFIAGEGDQ